MAARARDARSSESELGKKGVIEAFNECAVNRAGCIDRDSEISKIECA